MTAQKTEVDNPLEGFVRQYYRDPVGFVVEILGVKPLRFAGRLMQI